MSIQPPAENPPVVESVRPRPVLLSVQLRSQRSWNLERLNRAFLRDRSDRFFDFLTAGTSNKTPEELTDILKRKVFACNCLIDVRSNPNSRHTPYWNKSSMSKLLEKEGITYLHKPELGVPTEIRRQLYSGKTSHQEFFAWYDSNVLTLSRLGEISKLVKDFAVTFLCTEVGPTYCHRHRIALKLEAKGQYVSFDL